MVSITFPQLAMIPGSLLFTAVGGYRVFAPLASMALLKMEIDPTDANLLNELVGNHALCMGLGILGILGFFRKDLRKIGLLGLAYNPVMYGFGRIVSSFMNGMPNEEIQFGMKTEFFLAALAILGYMQENKTTTEDGTKKD